MPSAELLMVLPRSVPENRREPLTSVNSPEPLEPPSITPRLYFTAQKGSVRSERRNCWSSVPWARRMVSPPGWLKLSIDWPSRSSAELVRAKSAPLGGDPSITSRVESASWLPRTSVMPPFTCTRPGATAEVTSHVLFSKNQKDVMVCATLGAFTQWLAVITYGAGRCGVSMRVAEQT